MTESPSTPSPPPPGQSGPSGQSGHSGQQEQPGQTDQSGQAGPTGQAGQHGHHGHSGGSTLSEFRRLRRAKAGRVVGGVCAGLGRDLRIDPVILRVLVAVMIFFGGAGLLIYGAAWLLIPEEGDDPRSILERQLGRRPNGQPDNAVVIGGVVVLFLLIASVPWWGFSWHPAALLLLAGAGLYFLLRRSSGSQPGDGFGATPPGPPSGSGDGVQSWFGEQHPVNSPADSPAGAGGQRPTGPAGAPGAPVPSAAPAMGAASGVTAPAGPAGPMGPGGPSWPNGPAGDTGPGGPNGPGGPGRPYGPGGPNGPDGPGDPSGPGGPGGTGGLAMPEPSPTGSWRDFRPLPRDFWNQPDPLGLESEPSTGESQLPAQWTPPPPPAPRQRSRLFWVTSAFALIVLGAMALIDQAANVSVPAAGYVAAPLVVVGLGLIAGAWWGRSPGLVVTGVLLSLALVPTSVGDYVTDAGAGTFVHRPMSVSEIKPSYDYGAGQFTLDLRNVTFADEDTVKTSIDCGACEVQVLLPANVDTTVTADVALGDMQLFPRFGSEPDSPERPEVPDRPGPADQFDESGRPLGPEIDGVDDQLRTTDLGTDGPGGGKLNLNIDLGVGNLEVSRG
jgi:phage shock protein PspC (stress-responsive transcriptional regulator)